MALNAKQVKLMRKMEGKGAMQTHDKEYQRALDQSRNYEELWAAFQNSKDGNLLILEYRFMKFVGKQITNQKCGLGKVMGHQFCMNE